MTTMCVPLAAATHISATRSKPVGVSGCLLQLRLSGEYQTAPKESDLMAVLAPSAAAART